MRASFAIAAVGLAIAAVTTATAFAQVEVTANPSATEIVGEVGGPEITESMAGGFTLETVEPDRPFAELDIDPTVSRDEANAKLTLAEREELLGRCAVVIANEAHYEAAIATFCASYNSTQ